MNAADADVANYIRIFSLKSKEEIEALEAEHNPAPQMRLLQHALADEITTRVHSAEELIKAKEITAKFFGSSFEEFKQLTPADIEDSFEEDATYRMSAADVVGANVVNVVGSTTIYDSKGDTKKGIQGNGVSINKQKVTLDKIIAADDLLYGKYLLVQKGKKNYYLIIAE